LALERLGLLDFAKDAWQAIQQTHSAAGWRDEARNHLAQVERQMRVSEFAITSDDVLRASPDQLAGFLERGLDDVRRVVEDELVPLLGRICTPASRSDCADLLNRVQAIAAAMAEASPDRQVVKLAENLARWGPRGLADATRAAALISYGEG